MLKTHANTFVISAEDLCLLTVEELAALAQAFRRVEPDLAIEIVFYVRRWSDLLPSVVQELIKQGVASTVSDILAKELLAPERSDVLNYVNRLDRFSAVFGAEAIKIIAYDNVIEAGDNLIDHFFRHILGCKRSEADAYDVAAQHNSSITFVETEFLRVRNCLVQAGAIAKFSGNAGDYLQKLHASNIEHLVKAMRGRVRELVIDETVSPFTHLYETLREKYERRFLNPLSEAADPLFRRVQRGVKYVSPDYLCEVAVLNQIIALNWSLNKHGA